MSLVVWKIDPCADQIVAQFLRVDQVAVVGDGDLAVRAVDQDRLRVLEAALAGGGIPHMADSARAGQPPNRRFVEVVGDVAHRLVHLQPVAVGRRDADALLAAMLERVQAEVGHVGRFGVAEDAEDAALFSELVHHSSGDFVPAEPPSHARSRSPGAPSARVSARLRTTTTALHDRSRPRVHPV